MITATGPRTPAVRLMIVAEDEPAYRAVVEELLGAGWRLASSGCTSPAGDPRVITVCPVRDADEIGWAVLAATRGPVLIHTALPAAAVDDLLDDLARLGPVRLAGSGTTVALDQDTWRLVHHLAAGSTTAAAARALHMSLRTANRRLAEARDALRAPTRGALLAALRRPDRVPAPPG